MNKLYTGAGLIVVACGLLALSGCEKKSTTSFAEIAKLIKDEDGKVTVINIRFQTLSHDALATLSDYPDLERLTIQECKGVTDAMLKDVAGLAGLEQLELLGVPITDAALAHLKANKSITTLLLGSTKVNGRGLSQLADTNIVNLELLGPEFTTEGVRSLAKLAKLETLFVQCANVEIGGIGDLSSLNKLTSWISYMTPNGKGVGKVIANLTGLQSLHLSAIGLNDQELQAITTQIPSLTDLTLSNAEVTDQGLLQVGELPLLEKLDLSGCEGISDDGLAHLGNLNSLTYLNFVGASVSGTGLTHLTSLSSLQRLEFFQSQFKPGPAEDEFRQACPNCKISLLEG
jgi:F-box/leucine-rich repeat protein 14